MISNSFSDSCLVCISGLDCKAVYNDELRTFNFNDIVTCGNLVSTAGRSTEQEENRSNSTDMPVSTPKYTTSEKWIMNRCERKVLEEKNWALKQRRVEEKTAVCFDRLKVRIYQIST